MQGLHFYQKRECMFGPCLATLFFLVIFWLPPSVQADVLGQITMEDGSIIHGDIVDMVGGVLQVKAVFGAGDPFQITWEKVANLATSQPVTLILTKGITLQGIAQKGEPGVILLQTTVVSILIPIQLSSVSAINPPEKKPVKFTANLDFGGKFSEGNTVDKQANLLSSFTARSKRLRFRLDFRYFYSEDNGSVTDRNAFGNMQLDFFMSPRFYWYGGVLLEQDTFDDLNLRTAITTGPGYQFIEKGDYSHKNLQNMELSGEIGAGIINEDRKIAEDENFGTFRWGANWNWEPIPDILIFHRHQGFPSMEDVSDFYINTITGIKFGIWKGLNLGLQFNYKYDNTPPPGSKSWDFRGLMTVGYTFED